MKIEFDTINDFYDLVHFVELGKRAHANGPVVNVETVIRNAAMPVTGLVRDVEGIKQQLESGHISAAFAAAELAARDEPDGLPTDIARPAGVATTNEPGPVGTDELPERDGEGAPYNTDWHSDPAKINADGRWRARRKRDEDAYKAWLLEQAVEVAEAATAADAEPVATETHALPQDEDQAATEAGMAAEAGAVTEESSVPAPTVDLAALVEASQEAALDASDSHMDLIKACQGFISDHGHPAYNALKAAVAPKEGVANGKAVPEFTPGERRLMRACMANYPTT